MKKIAYLSTICVFFFILVFLAIGVRGQKGNPLYFQNTYDTKVGGPFEASNSTSRYALTEAIVKNKSFFLTPVLAKFASPDVIIFKGNYVSIFTPGVSFL